MATEASKFRIGLFVSVGLIIAIGAVIALGASRFFQDTRTYVTYFEESVQGLQPDSLVRYRGVPIGRVHKIRIAPDGRLVEAVLKIDAKVEIDPDMRIQIRMAGITGMKYLEIDRKESGEPEAIKELGFEAPHPVIPCKPSEVEEILASVDEIFQKLRALDVEGISDRLKESLDSLLAILEQGQWHSTLKNIERTTASLSNASSRIDTMLGRPGVEDLLADASESLKSLKRISARLEKDLEGAALGERITTATNKMDRFMEDAIRTSEEIRFVVT
jgi:phospholipid/cholesterol/gamma-HCH transport system substrate-binding protein